MKPLPDQGTLVPSNDLPDTGTLTSAMLDLGTMVINSDTDNEATMKSTFFFICISFLLIKMASCKIHLFIGLSSLLS